MTRRPSGLAACPDPPRAPEERLAFILRSPDVIERSVRAALHSSLAVRTSRSKSPDVRTFGNRALEALDVALTSERPTLDAIERHELQAATLRAGARFVRSKLARRLFELPPARFAEAPPQADVAVRDEGGHLHVVRLEATATLAQRAQTARAIAGALRTGAIPLRPPAVHLFSLRDGRLRSFGEFATNARPQSAKNALRARRAS